LTNPAFAGRSPDPAQPAPCVFLLVPARSYRTADFLAAAGRMGVDLVVGSDGALPLGGRPVIPVTLANPRASAERLRASAERLRASGVPVAAVVAADAPMLVLAAAVAARLGLPHNRVAAVRAAADKARQRTRWALAGLAQPAFRIVPAVAPDDAVRRAAQAVGFPCVVKAVSLSASQGVLRADDTAAAVAAARRIRSILAQARRPAGEPLLVEAYVAGPELSIDGLLSADGLSVTAVFDKPATPDGPTFEETMLVTPSRLPGAALATAVGAATLAARALGLSHGPIHAELRLDDRARGRPMMLELAARSIGGLCSRALRFADSVSLEELVLANALGRDTAPAVRQTARPSGVLMLPVSRPGTLRSVEGRDRAAAVPGITGLTITIPVGQRVRPLPEGDRYLGFIFAEGDTQRDVERALDAARARLRVIIE
jgi:biotin carboxylase